MCTVHVHYRSLASPCQYWWRVVKNYFQTEAYVRFSTRHKACSPFANYDIAKLFLVSLQQTFLFRHESMYIAEVMRHDVIPRGWTACPAKCKSKALLCRLSVTVACVVKLEFSFQFCHAPCQWGWLLTNTITGSINSRSLVNCSGLLSPYSQSTLVSQVANASNFKYTWKMVSI